MPPPEIPAALEPQVFRADGWPLCPACGEDEVYSLLWNGPEPRPSLARFLASELRCYACRWRRPATETP